MYMYTYMYVCMYVCMYKHISLSLYIYIERLPASTYRSSARARPTSTPSSPCRNPTGHSTLP